MVANSGGLDLRNEDALDIKFGELWDHMVRKMNSLEESGSKTEVDHIADKGMAQSTMNTGGHRDRVRAHIMDKEPFTCKAKAEGSNILGEASILKEADFMGKALRNLLDFPMPVHKSQLCEILSSQGVLLQ